MKDYENLINNASGSIEEKAFSLVPPECKVIFYNDDHTTMDFVVAVLVSIFNKSTDEAESIMRTVHETGEGVVGTYTYDIAVSRANLTTSVARKNGFPLRVEVE